MDHGSDNGRFVIVGLSRLSVRVARALGDAGNEVAVVSVEDDRNLDRLLPDGTKAVEGAAGMEGALEEAGVAGATCLLALSDDDMVNLDAAVAGSILAPRVPVVLRAFDPVLADQLQGLNIRRAYSVSALAAPTFVAAALADEVVVTLRIGADEVSLLRLSVRPGSPIIGRTAAQVKRDTGCAVIAGAGNGGGWRPVGLDEQLDMVGERLLVGGLLRPALRLAIRNVGTVAGRSRSRPEPPPHSPLEPEQVSAEAETIRRVRARSATLLPVTAAVLTAVLVASVLVFGIALHLGPVDAVYVAITTALGNSTLDESDAWLKVVGVVSMILGGALLGVLFSWLASVATAQRLEQRMGRHARELRGHAVVIGLGTVGYRVERLLHELGIRTAVVDRDPDPRFVEVVGERTPVLTGDVRLPENLERAGIRQARWLLACTSDDLTNIESCIAARRLNGSIRTVARIFNEDLAERLGGSFGIDVAVSASAVAARAFVGAATDERAFRTFAVGDEPYLAFRFQAELPVEAERIQRWRDAHVRILAFRRDGRKARPPSELAGGLEPGDSVILAGPADAIRSEVLGEGRHASHAGMTE